MPSLEGLALCHLDEGFPLVIVLATGLVALAHSTTITMDATNLALGLVAFLTTWACATHILPIAISGSDSE
jgi:hypothetical protein